MSHSATGCAWSIKVHIVDTDAAPAAVLRLADPQSLPACVHGAVTAVPDDVLAWYRYDDADLPPALRGADGSPSFEKTFPSGPERALPPLGAYMREGLQRGLRLGLLARQPQSSSA